MTNSMVVYERMAELQTAANAMHASGYFGDVKSQAQAMVKVMAGAEIGLPPFASMSGIHIVNGKPTLGANLIATLVKNDPRYDYRVKRSDNEACVLTWYEGGKPVGESMFTIQEANAAGLTSKQTWKAYASDMLFARALTRGARRYAPGIFGGAPIYTPDEMGVDTDEDGHIVQGEVVNVTPPATQPTRATGNGQQQTQPPLDAFLAQAEKLPGVQAVEFVNGRLRAWVEYVTDKKFDPAHADFLFEVLDRYCSAVADNGNTHTKAAAEKARADYRQGLAALNGDGTQDDLFGDDDPAARAAALATAQGQLE